MTINCKACLRKNNCYAGYERAALEEKHWTYPCNIELRNTYKELINIKRYLVTGIIYGWIFKRKFSTIITASSDIAIEELECIVRKQEDIKPRLKVYIANMTEI